MTDSSAFIYYRHYAADPYFNMAFDEWMLRQAMHRPEAVYLRLYSWMPGAITFGYNQRFERAIDASKLGDTPVIRRVTGGRAIYHDPSEITYAIASNADSKAVQALSGSTSEVSARIAEALALFLSRLRIDAEYVRQSSAQNSRPDFFHAAPCFASLARYELVAGERKVVASAQKRLGNAFLQHGAIKLNGVVSHGALPNASTDVIQFMQPLDRPTFDSLSGRFVEAFGVH
ncbi:MAG TPA: hypothetical protein VMS71_03805, partial [Candidatus Acidoferrum sp.]|nr:hypothetical protein [Candidatus Acidoferrum sp.]